MCIMLLNNSSRLMRIEIKIMDAKLSLETNKFRKRFHTTPLAVSLISGGGGGGGGGGVIRSGLKKGLEFIFPVVFI